MAARRGCETGGDLRPGGADGRAGPRSLSLSAGPELACSRSDARSSRATAARRPAHVRGCGGARHTAAAAAPTRIAGHKRLRGRGWPRRARDAPARRSRRAAAPAASGAPRPPPGGAAAAPLPSRSSYILASFLFPCLRLPPAPLRPARCATPCGVRWVRPPLAPPRARRARG